MATMRSLALLAQSLAWLLLGIHGTHARATSRSNILARGEDVKPEYDYVIVGGGTAGLTVADRLTESGKCKVFH
jgi:choline dehydrogenase